VEILSRLLTKKNYVLAVAGNRADAVALAKSELPDLILMDIGIPDGPGTSKNDSGGLEATREIKSAEATCRIPIIALTAHAMLDDRNRFLDAGCDGVQTKPYSFAQLLEAIQAKLEN
jgi:CheY-like chemotaxis protein